MQPIGLRGPSAGDAIVAAIANTRRRKMPGQRTVQYPKRTAKAIQWLGVLTLVQAVGIAGLVLIG